MDEQLATVVEPLAGDASTRRYARVRSPGGVTSIRVEYPADSRARLQADLAALRWLAERGVRMPRVIEHDPDAGVALLEDFGPHDAEVRIRDCPPSDRPALARRLLAPLVALAAIPVDRFPPWNAPLDRSRLRWELAGWELWWVRHRRRRQPPPAVSSWLDDLAGAIAAHPLRVCHRDFHLNNLFLLPDEEVGVIDAQDLLVGPDTYDLASLLGERAMPALLPVEARAEVARAWAEATEATAGWRDRLELVALQRGLKVLGTFSRLVASGRPEYRRWLEELAPRVGSRSVSLAAPSELAELLLDS